VDGPRHRYPADSSNERSSRGRSAAGGRGGRGAQEGGARFPRREQRPANPQSQPRRTIHYQVVMMDDEEWGDTLEQRLNTLGREGWRLVAIDEGRQYVFVQAD